MPLLLTRRFDPWKHGFELHGSTYTWFSSIENTIILHEIHDWGICVCREQHRQKANWVTDGFLTAWRVGTPNPGECDRLTVDIESLTMPQEFWPRRRTGWWAELNCPGWRLFLSSRGFLFIFQNTRVIDAVRRLLHRFSFLGVRKSLVEIRHHVYQTPLSPQPLAPHSLLLVLCLL